MHNLINYCPRKGDIASGVSLYRGRSWDFFSYFLQPYLKSLKRVFRGDLAFHGARPEIYKLKKLRKIARGKKESDSSMVLQFLIFWYQISLFAVSGIAVVINLCISYKYFYHLTNYWIIFQEVNQFFMILNQFFMISDFIFYCLWLVAIATILGFHNHASRHYKSLKNLFYGKEFLSFSCNGKHDTDSNYVRKYE